VPQCITQSFYYGSVSPDLLAPARALEPDRQRVLVRNANVSFDIETGGIETHDVHVPRATGGAQKTEVVHRLEQVRLALAVLPDDG
jgi:hypothetical protein